MKKKICILQNGLARGGTDTFVVNLCKGLNPDIYDIIVINPSNKPESIIHEPEIQALGVRVIHTSPLYLGIKSKIKHLYMLFQILKKEKVDIFQTNIDLFNGPQLFIAWIARVPIRCCHSHNSMQQRALVEGKNWKIILYQYLMRWMCWTFSNRRTGCSESAMDFLFRKRKWQQQKYPSIINNGIDINLFRKPIDIDNKRNELNLKAKYHIITIGHIIPQKNPIFIADVFSQLSKQRSDVDLIWIGSGEKKSVCEQIFKKNNCLSRVHFLDTRSDINEILQCCDLFFFPSAFEGLGIVVIEAQASGLQCLVSDKIPQESNCGAVMYMSLEEPLNKWVQTLTDMLDKKITMSTKEESIQKFSIEHMVKQMEEVFKKN